MARTSFIAATAATLVAFLLSCTPTDPNVVKFAAYYQSATGFINGYQQVGMRFRDFNNGDNSDDPDEAIRQIKTMLKPLQTMSTDAAALNLGDAAVLQQLHNRLVEGLTKKHEAYSAMVKAYEDNDATAFRKAQEDVVAATALLAEYEEDLERLRRQIGR